MSESTSSGWDRLHYPYGLLNIKGGFMPSYPNFVRGGELNITPIQYLFNSMFKFENVDSSLTQTAPGLVIIPLLNVYY